jgi:hypothetical protein
MGKEVKEKGLGITKPFWMKITYNLCMFLSTSSFPLETIVKSHPMKSLIQLLINP